MTASSRIPPSEDAILACLSAHFKHCSPRLRLGRGDDCAIIGSGSQLCVSTDMFLEDVHFRTSYFTPEETGYKALAVNISDLAGCGAKPVAFTLCLGLPHWADMEWLNGFFAGMASLAEPYGLALAGGDLSRSDRLHISIAIFGESPEGCDFLTRGGSMPGDLLFVVGDIGLARVGLMELESRGREAINLWPAACAAHLAPKPRIAAGLMLARAGHNSRPPALMDLSDGILRDLPRLLGHSGELGAPSSSLGARLGIGPVNLHPEVVEHARQYGQDAVMQAMLGGEDYALLGSCAPDMFTALNAAIPGFMPIGEVTDSGHIICNGRGIESARGFDHFDDPANLENRKES